ncbi:MAG: hypothetical protein MPN21_18030 [Thermoanaerobaculia bacterium]|nr:hypothetical protein [Thermoanaerobaculia bacterium]
MKLTAGPDPELNRLDEGRRVTLVVILLDLLDLLQKEPGSGVTLIL